MAQEPNKQGGGAAMDLLNLWEQGQEKRSAAEDVLEMDSALREREERTRTLTAMDALREAIENPSQMVPWLQAVTSSAELGDLVLTSRKMQRGEATEAEEKRVIDAVAKANQPRTFGNQVVGLLTDMPAFIGEFASSLGVGKAAVAGGKRLLGKAAQEAAEGAVAAQAKRGLRRLAGKAATLAAEVGVQTALNETASLGLAAAMDLDRAGGRITADAFRRQFEGAGIELSEDEAGELAIAFTATMPDFVDVLPQAIASQLIENASERAGGGLAQAGRAAAASKAGQAVASRIPVSAKIAALQARVFQFWRGKNPDAPLHKFFDLVAKQGGWHGPFGEWAEERIGGAMRAAVPGMSEGWEDVFPGLEQQAVELTAFSVPGAVRMGAEAAFAPGQQERPTLDGEPSEDRSADSLQNAERAAEGPTEAAAEPGLDDSGAISQSLADLDPATIPERAALMGQREGAEPQAVRHATQIKDRDKRRRVGALAAMAERFGVRLVPVESETGEALARPAMKGDPGIVFWDVNATRAEDRERGAGVERGRLYHELVHEIADVDADLYRDLSAAVGRAVSPEIRARVLADYEQRLGQSVPESVRDEETVANLTEALEPILTLADAEGGRAALERIATEDPGLFQRIVEWVKGLSNRVLGTQFTTRLERQLGDLGLSGGLVEGERGRGAVQAALVVQDALQRIQGRAAPSVRAQEATAAQAEPEAAQEAPEAASGARVGQRLPGRPERSPATFTPTQEKKVRRRLQRAERAARTLREQAETATPAEAQKLRARAAYQDQRAADYRDQLRGQEDLQLGDQAAEVQEEAARRRPFEPEMFPRRVEETRMERARRIAAEGEERPDQFAAPGRPSLRVKREFTSFDLPEEGWRDRWIRRTKDEFRRIYRLESELAKRGQGVTPDESAYQAARRATSKMTGELRNLDRRFLEPVRDALRTLARAEVPLETADRYVNARHAPSRNEEIARRHPQKYGDVEQSPGSGMPTSEANRIVREAESGPNADAYRALGEAVDKLNEESLRVRRDAGLISEDYYDTLVNQWDHYVPYKDDNDSVPLRRGGGFAIRGKEFRKAEGRSREAENVIAQSIAQATEAIHRAERNRVGQAFHDVLRNRPDVTGWTEERPEEYVDPRTLRDNQFSLKRDGQQIVLTVSDAKLVEAIKRLGTVQMGPVGNVLRKFARYFSAVNTQYSPGFIPTNFLRDLQAALIHTASLQDAGMAAEVLPNVPKAVRGMWGFLRDGNRSGHWAKMAQRFNDAGGMVGWFQQKTVEEVVKDLQAGLQGTEGNPGRAALAKVRGVAQFIDNMNQSLENGVRLAAFEAMVQRGKSDAEAGAFARELTVDFTSKGDWTPWTNTLYVFSNAGLGGTFVMARVLQTKTGKAFASSLIGAGFAIALMNLMVGGDDEDGVPHFAKTPEGTRGKNLVLMYPDGSGRKITIPMPYGWNFFHALGTEAALLATGNTDPGEATSATASAFVDAWMPIGGEATGAQVVSPTLLDPFVQHMQNTTWYGGPIMPEENPYGPGEPYSSRYFKSVSKASQAVTTWLNRVTGGDDVVPGAVDISPETLDHFSQFFGGNVGATVKRGLVDIPAKVLAGEAPETREIPIVRRFFRGPEEYWTSSTYYENRRAAERLEAQIRSARNDRDMTRLNALRRENAGLFRMASRFKDTDKRLRALRDQHDRAQTDEQREAIKERIRRLQVRTNRQFFEIVEGK